MEKNNMIEYITPITDNTAFDDVIDGCYFLEYVNNMILSDLYAEAKTKAKNDNS